MQQRMSMHERWALGAYRIVFLLALPLLWLGMFWRGLRERAYFENTGQRWGCIDVLPGSWGGILIHAASLGEVHAARPLVDALLKRYPARMITVSCQTPTGLAQVRSQWAGQVRAVYLPLDLQSACQRFLERLQPRLVILLEREIWPVLLRQCEARVIPVALVNARLSERSSRLSQKLGALMRPALAQLCAVHAADEHSAQRLMACGAVAERVKVGGNLKFDIPIQEAWDDAAMKSLGAIQDRPVVLLASSHDDEEAQALRSWPQVQVQFPSALLVIVPRHPHRFAQVAQLIERSGMQWKRRSASTAVLADDQVLLVDQMGELQQWYRLATVCAVAGSWANIGGHNALEALLVGKPVLFGPHTHNFETLYQDIEQAGAGERTSTLALMMQTALQWLQQPQLLATASDAAAHWVAQHRGADARAMAQLEPFLPTVMDDPQQRVQGLSTVWQSQALRDVDLPWDFNLLPADTAPAPAIPRGGRGQVRLFQRGGFNYILRHYHRGGLVGKLMGDRFLRTLPHLSRAMKEYHLLGLMQTWRLPVPQALAARHQSGWMFDRCDLVMSLIEGANTLHTQLIDGPLAQSQWQQIGRMIAHFHTHQIDHTDLNCHNILLQFVSSDDPTLFTPYLIDFDKCQLRTDHAWKQSNLDRLQRSLIKEKRLQPKLHWEELHWPWLLEGYAAARSGALKV